MPTPTNKILYKKVLLQAKKKFDVYPSAYANSWVSQQYRSLGGKYSGKKSPSLDIAIFAFEHKKARSLKKSLKKSLSKKKRTSRKKSRKQRKRA